MALGETCGTTLKEPLREGAAREFADPGFMPEMAWLGRETTGMATPEGPVRVIAGLTALAAQRLGAGQAMSKARVEAATRWIKPFIGISLAYEVVM